MNGKMKRQIEELKQLASDKDISTDVALRLMCSVQADFAETISDMTERDKKADTEVAVVIEGMEVLARSSEVQTKALEELTTKLDEKVFRNPLVIAGDFIREHPKIATSIFVLMLIASNLWFVSGFRRAIMLLLNIPPEIIDAIAP